MLWSTAEPLLINEGLERPATSGTRPQLVGGATIGCALAAVQSLATNGPAEVVSSPEMAEASALASFPRSRVGAWMKRVGNVAVAIIGLAFMLPLLGAVAAAIYLDDGGPALFTQERIGLPSVEPSSMTICSQRGSVWASTLSRQRPI